MENDEKSEFKKKKNHKQCICLNSYAKGLEILRLKKTTVNKNMQWCFAKIIWKKKLLQNHCKQIISQVSSKVTKQSLTLYIFGINNFT